uniref:metallophosphoesterase family protein n=1 Tax=Klebsiella pneumoniae TaxID=573 RepID=UPI001954B7FA
MRRISQISDLHFGRTDPAVVEGLVRELDADRPDLLIISGDFTMAARRSEYAEAQAFLARLPKPWIAVPGNR